MNASTSSFDMEVSSTNLISNNHDKHKLKSSASASDLQTLLSTAVRKPPSHILADGTFVHLPEPTHAERAAFFERAVAQNRLVSATDQNIDIKDESDVIPENDKDSKNSKAQNNSSNSKKKKKDDETQKIHPIAIASARINGKGVQELSKAINLGDLVGFGEYFGLANIVNNANVNIGSIKEDSKDSKLLEKSTNSSDPQKTDLGASTNNDGKEGNNGSSADSSSKNNSSTSTTSAGIDSAAILEEQKLRASYLLKHKQSQFTQSAQIMKKQANRLSKILLRQKIIDYRLLQLRKHWRLVAPEHGTRAIGPVRPTEVVAIDVEIYDRDRTGGGNAALMQSINSSTTNVSQKRQQQEQGFMNTNNRPGKIARMVPRYATIDVRDGCEVNKTQLFPPKTRHKRLKEESSNENNKGKMMSDNSDEDESDTSKTSHKTAFTNNLLNSNLLPNLTISEPFAVADPTLGKIDPDFDPDKVPILTLLMSIEKACTGYIQHCTLSSSSSPSFSNQSLSLSSIDEEVITTLQHSLFCASLFESIRREITTNKNNISKTSYHNSSISSTSVWLSDGMEETFLPPPSHMTSNSTNGSSGLCVIHCHESEVKVRLDSEYSLSIQLIEAGTALDVTTEDKSKNETNENALNDESGSGSQSPEQLKVLCRTLLLQAQFMYHDHSMKNRIQTISNGETKKDDDSKKKSSNSTNTITTQVIPSSPHILEQCVALGSKIIFERKIRSSLQVNHGLFVELFFELFHFCSYVHMTHHFFLLVKKRNYTNG